MSSELDKSSPGEVSQHDILSGFEIDVIGEIMNISMGSAATAVSTLLDKKVIITTPDVHVAQVKELDYDSFEPAICVEITYITGISGSNVMVLKQSDMKLILDQLMGMPPTPDPDYVFDEISISAACEVMNQMMGSAATALSNFLGRPINISTPVAYVLSNEEIKKNLLVNLEDYVVVIYFDLTIEGITQSKFMSILQMDLAKEIVSQSQMFNMTASESPAPAKPEELPQISPADEKLLNKVYDAPQFDTPVPTAAPAPAPSPMPQYAAQPYPPQMPQPQQPYPQQMYPPQYYQQPPMQYDTSRQQPVDIHNVNYQNFTNLGQPSPDGQHTNLDLIMQVPLQVSVEIGKTRRKIKDILEFSQGMVIELEKQAGAPVDIIVNGQLVAKGDVVVVEDNFGVRITEILKNTDFLNGIS
ncbi:flagellar motor switch phosphatase FliY [Acetanaerobacterium elongatum]|uniref:Flagellar motor switch protein FliN/FliY n=1 Tax=Acetanaerobacterium elongatum TaxID=258515 RepID=A0A1G9ZF31_9FIRM|nr:flagellar motor switch phosphatase FliY [Acetanaerobacterium elongatum]SDN19939.1 flagellar motor switch protein FliN/FliY [Acetanaerobacterium elongatum]